MLVAGGPHRFDRIVRKAESLRGARRGDCRLILPADDGLEGTLLREFHDPAAGRVRIAKVEGECPPRSSLLEGLPLIGAHDDLHTETNRRMDEIAGPVGGRRHEQENSRHGHGRILTSAILRRDLSSSSEARCPAGTSKTSRSASASDILSPAPSPRPTTSS